MPSEDIKNLFSRFGNRSGRYHEIVREDQRTDSVGRWPLLSAVKVGEVRSIPGVSVREPQRVLDVPHASGSRPIPQGGGEAHSSSVVASVSPLAAVGSKHLTPAVVPVAAREGGHGGSALFGRSNGGFLNFPASVPVGSKVDSLSFPGGIKAQVAPAAQLMPDQRSSEAVQVQRDERVSATSLASIGDRSLKSVFGRLGGFPPQSQDDSDALRAVPIFRRLRRP